MSNDIAAQLKGLKLHGMASTWPELLAQSRHTDFEPERFMKQLLMAETAERQVRSIAYQMTAALPGPPRPEGLRLRAGTRRRSAGARTERAVVPRKRAQRRVHRWSGHWQDAPRRRGRGRQRTACCGSRRSRCRRCWG
ncbi:ATP-binding protein [Streptomyces sp. NPDC001056]